MFHTVDNNLSFSFIGVTQSLPATAYIKMIDIWLIICIIYPFCMVALYSLYAKLAKNIDSKPIDLKNDDRNDTWEEKILKAVRFMLDFGLSTLFSMFVFIFWLMGLTA